MLISKYLGLSDTFATKALLEAKMRQKEQRVQNTSDRMQPKDRVSISAGACPWPSVPGDKARQVGGIRILRSYGNSRALSRCSSRGLSSSKGTDFIEEEIKEPQQKAIKAQESELPGDNKETMISSIQSQIQHVSRNWPL